MHAPWFYCPDLRPGEARLPAAEARHAFGTLRLGPGQLVTLFDGRGRWAAGRLRRAADTSTSRRRRTEPAHLVVDVNEVRTAAPPQSPLTVVTAAAKGERLDWLIEKCTELGVSAIVLAEFERSVVHAGPPHLERAGRVALAACKQCRRARVPVIRVAPLPASFTEGVATRHAPGAAQPPPAGAAHGPAVADAPTPEPPALLVADPAPDAPWLADWVVAHRRAAACIVVGPEGGLAPAEEAALRAAGGVSVRLAPHILRTETAAIAAAAIWAGHGETAG